MKKLLRGIEEWRRNRRAAYGDMMARLAGGQAPRVLAIACSDSRVSPMEFASSEPGDVFVVRNVGNLVAPFDASDDPHSPSAGAAIEYALAVLPIEDIVVCGHAGCGAIKAIREGNLPEATPHLKAWLAQGRRLLEGIPLAPSGLSASDHLSQQSVLRQIENLRTYPRVRDGERAGRIRLTAWWIDIARAEVLDHDASLGRFVPLDEDRIARQIAALDRAKSPGPTPR